MMIYMLLVEVMINIGWSEGQIEKYLAFFKRLGIGAVFVPFSKPSFIKYDMLILGKKRIRGGMNNEVLHQ